MTTLIYTSLCAYTCSAPSIYPRRPCSHATLQPHSSPRYLHLHPLHADPHRPRPITTRRILPHPIPIRNINPLSARSTRSGLSPRTTPPPRGLHLERYRRPGPQAKSTAPFPIQRLCQSECGTPPPSLALFRSDSGTVRRRQGAHSSSHHSPQTHCHPPPTWNTRSPN